MPLDKVGTGSVIGAGRIKGNGTTDVGAGQFSVTKSATKGEWILTIPG